MKLTMRTNVKCPNCHKEATVETGFWGALFFSALFPAIEKRIRTHGATLTCSHCGRISEITPKASLHEPN